MDYITVLTLGSTAAFAVFALYDTFKPQPRTEGKPA